MRILVGNERAEGGEVADEVSDDDASLLRLRPGDANGYVGRGYWVGRGDDYCGINAQQ